MLQCVTEYNRVSQNAKECYRVLQSVTECYRVLQSVTECYRVLQIITEYNTEYYRVLQSITEYYKILQSISSASTWTNFWACYDWFEMDNLILHRSRLPTKSISSHIPFFGTLSL